MRRLRAHPPLAPILFGQENKATQRCTNWALRVFQAWRSERNKASVEKCPDDLFEAPSLPSLNKWLSAFVVEARREDGQRYPATTLTNLLLQKATVSSTRSDSACCSYILRSYWMHHLQFCCECSPVPSRAGRKYYITFTIFFLHTFTIVINISKNYKNV